MTAVVGSKIMLFYVVIVWLGQGLVWLGRGLGLVGTRFRFGWDAV